ncbi:hypothetical protein ACHWQZ_G009590 [Mnemiopsis leidyi]
MDWLCKKWIIEDEEGEKEFLSALFSTEDVVCTEEDVSTLNIINVAGDFYIVELVSIADDSYKKYYSFPSYKYSPQTLKKTDEGIETYDTDQLTIRDKLVKTGFDEKLKEGEFDYQQVFSGHGLLYFQPVIEGCYLERAGLRLCIQTISNRFYVRISENPKYIKIDSNQEEGIPVKTNRGQEYSIKRKYTPPDETGRCTLEIEMTCNGAVARISAYSNG